MDRTMSRSLPYLPRYQSASPARSSRLGGRRFTSLRSVSQPSARILYVMGEPTRAFISPHQSPSPHRSYRHTLISTKLKQPVSRVSRSRSASDMMSSHLYTSSEEALPSALREDGARRKAESCDDMYHKGPFFPDVTASESGVSMGGSEDSSLYGGEDDAMSQNSFGSSSAFFEVTVDSELDRMEGDSLGDRTLDILYEHDLDHRGAGVKAARHARPPYRDVISPDSSRSSPSLTYGDARKRELMHSPSWDLDKTVSRLQALRVSIPGEVKSPRDGASGRDGDKKSLPSTPLAQSTPHVSPRGGTARLSVKACWDIDDPYGEDDRHKLKPGAARALFEPDVSDTDLSRSPRVDESSCYSSNSEDNFSDVSSATVASTTPHRKTKLVKKASDRPASARVGGSSQTALVSVTAKQRRGESECRDGVPRRNVHQDHGPISRASDVSTSDSCFSQAEAMLREQATTPRAGQGEATRGETGQGHGEGAEWWAVFNIESAQARKAEGSLEESGDAGSNCSQDVHVVRPVKVNIPLISAGKHGQDKLRRLSRSPPCSGGMSPSLELSASGDGGDWSSERPNTNSDQASTGTESGQLMKIDPSGFHTRPGESALGGEENEQRWSGLVFPHAAAAADGSATCGADQEENTRVCESSAELSASGNCSDVTSTATLGKQGREEEEEVERVEAERFGSEGGACQGEKTQLYPGSVKNFKSESFAQDSLPSPAHLDPSAEEGKGSNYRSLLSPTRDTLDTSTNDSTSAGVRGQAEAINSAIHPWVESPNHKTDPMGQFSSDKHDDGNTREVTDRHYQLGNKPGAKGPGAETSSRYLPAESSQVAEWNRGGSARLLSGPSIQLEIGQRNGQSTPERGGEEGSLSVRDEREKNHDADSVREKGSHDQKEEPVEEVNTRREGRVCAGLDGAHALVPADQKVLSSSQHPARELSGETGIVGDTLEGEVTVYRKQGREVTQDREDQEQTTPLSPCRRAGAGEEEENIDPGFPATGGEDGDQVTGHLEREGRKEREKTGGQGEEEEEDMEWQTDPSCPRRVRVYASAQTLAHDDGDDNNSDDCRVDGDVNMVESSSSSFSSQSLTHGPEARLSLSPSSSHVSSSRADTKSREPGCAGDPAVPRTKPAAELMSGDAARENTRESGQSEASPRHGSRRQQESVFRDFTNSRPCVGEETSILDEASGGGEEEGRRRRRKLGNKEFRADEAAWRGRRGSVERGEEFLEPPQPSRKQVLLEEISTTKRVKRILRETVEETVTVERKTFEPSSSDCVHLTDAAGQSVDIVTNRSTVIKEDEDCVTTTTTTTAYSDQAPTTTTTTPARSEHAPVSSENFSKSACSVNDTAVESRYDSVCDSTVPPPPVSFATSEQSPISQPPPLSPDAANTCVENTSAVLSPSTSRGGGNTGSLDRHNQPCVSVDAMDASVTLRQSQLDSLQEQLSQLTSHLSPVGTRDPARREPGSVYQDHAEATSVLKQIVRGDSGTFSRFSRFSDAERSVATCDGLYSSSLSSKENNGDAVIKESHPEREEYDNDYDYVTTDLPTRGSGRSVSQHQHHHQLQLLKPGQLKASSLWTLQEETESVLDGLSPRPSPKRSLATLNSDGCNEETADPSAPREFQSSSGPQEKSMWTSDENKNLQFSRTLLSGFHQQRVSEWSEVEESDGNYSSISTTESASHRSSSYGRERTPLSDSTEPSPLRELSGKLDYLDTRPGAGHSQEPEMISSFNDFVSGLDPRLFPRESLHQTPMSGPDGSSSMLTSAERDSGLPPPKVFKSSLAVTVTSPTDSDTSTLHDLSSSLEIFAKMGGSMSAHMDGLGATSASSSFLLSPSPCATPREDFLNTSGVSGKHSWLEETLSEGSSRLHALDLDLSRISSCASPSPSDLSETSSSHYICTGTAEVKKTSVFDYDLPPAPASTLRPKPCLKRPASDESEWKKRQTDERLKQFDQLLADFNKQTCGSLAFSELVFLDQSRAEGANSSSSSSGVADTATTGYDDLYKAFTNEDAEKKQNNVCIVLEDEDMSAYRFKRFLKKSHTRRHKGRRMLRFLSRLGCVSEGVHSPDMAANRKLVAPVPQKGEAPPTFSTDSMPARQRISNPVLISSTSFHHHHGLVPVSHVTGQLAPQTVDSPTSSNHSLDSFRSRADSAYSSISESLSVGGPCSPSRAPPSPSRAILRSSGSSAFRPKGSVDSAYSSTSGVRMWSEGDVMPLPSPSVASGDSDMLAALTDVFEQLDVCESEIDSALLSRMRHGHRQAHSNK